VHEQFWVQNAMVRSIDVAGVLSADPKRGNVNPLFAFLHTNDNDYGRQSMGDTRLLLVEDDTSLGEGIRSGLALGGYAVQWVTDGVVAEERLLQEDFAAVVLDIGLPRRSGLEVLTAMRARGDRSPVLLLTALDSVSDRINGLDSGADDYLPKPFDIDELNARLRALLRRHRDVLPRLVSHGPFTVDTATQTVMKGDERVNVSPHEFVILRLLLEGAGRVVPRTSLEDALYGWDADIESNTVEVHVHFLRKKLGDDLIRTVRGVGYMVDVAP